MALERVSGSADGEHTGLGRVELGGPQVSPVLDGAQVRVDSRSGSRSVIFAVDDVVEGSVVCVKIQVAENTLSEVTEEDQEQNWAEDRTLRYTGTHR